MYMYIQLHVFALVSNESISRCTYRHVCTHVHVLSVASTYLSFTGGGHAYWDGYGGLLQLLAGDITIPLFHCLCVQCSLHCTSDIISHCECPYCSALSVRVQICRYMYITWLLPRTCTTCTAYFCNVLYDDPCMHTCSYLC